MPVKTKFDGTVRDGNGVAPGNRQLCDNEDCQTCGGLGWILCDHIGTGRELAQNDDGLYDDWCALCDGQADELTSWTWCPERKN